MRTRVFTLVSLVVLPAAAVSQPGPTPIVVAPTVPPAFRLLDEPAVQKDVGLTDAQKTAAEQIRLCRPLAATGLRFGWFGHVPPDMMRPAIDQRTADFLAKDLTKEQRTRLNQILFQLREKQFGAHQAFAMAARDLGLRPDQLEDVRTLKALRVEEIANEVTSGKRFEKIKAEVQATNGETYEKMAEMLTRTQRERLKEMRGRAFVGKVDLSEPPPGPKISAETPTPPYPKELFGVYDYEIRFLGSFAIRNEIGIKESGKWGPIKVTGGVYNPVRRAVSEWESQYTSRGLRTETVGELSEVTSKALSRVLSEKQRQRFDELMTRRRLGYGGWEAACGYPPVVEKLKITPAQLGALRDGKHIEEVLTKDQNEQLHKLVGEPFEIATNVDDPVKARFKSFSWGAILPFPPKVAPKGEERYVIARDFLRLTDRLKLTAEQVKKLRDLAEDEPKVRELIRKELALDDTPPVAGAGRGQTAVNVVTEHYRAAVEQQCWDVLEPGQQSIARKLFGVGRK